ncbi:MAG: thiolase family protein [Streptococcaceae bacterium]|jgi:acetyl-CoA acetyltransferase family protein|nr:thiolase family protein [Streptococcaceae bacterium]
MKDIVILDALRTPIGKYKGSLSNLTSVELAAAVSKALIERNAAVKSDITEAIFGSVLTAGQGQNIARQISIQSGLSFNVPAFTVNEVCGSGLKAVLLARQSIALDEAKIVLAGGTESMSNAETMQIDGLTDAFENIPMGLTVEKLVAEYGITREAQDQLAYESHQKALNSDFSTEIIPVNGLGADEGPRPDSTLEKLAKLRTVFDEDGTITAGNASSVNDGAAAMLLSSREYADQHTLDYLAVIKNSVEIAVSPEKMGVSPVEAITQLLDMSGLEKEQIDRFEINESFAGSSLIIEQELKLDHSKVNVKGGAIAIGHPLGATGARLLVTLSHQLVDNNEQYGIAGLCIGGGLGIAVLLENPHYVG